MDLEKIYKDELNNLRNNLTLLSTYSIDSAKDKNWNQINRNRILIALYNNCIPEDYQISDFIFTKIKKNEKNYTLNNFYYISSF